MEMNIIQIQSVEILRTHYTQYRIHTLTAPYQCGILLSYKSLNTCGLIQIALLFFFLRRLILSIRFFYFSVFLRVIFLTRRVYGFYFSIHTDTHNSDGNPSCLQISVFTAYFFIFYFFILCTY